MTDKKTIAAIAAAGALGIGAWWFLFRDGDDGAGDTTPDTDKVYDKDTSVRLTDDDRGGGVTGQCMTRSGVLIPCGSQHYVFGNKVSVVNGPPVFGVQSYRRTRCTPTASVVVGDGDDAWNVLGRARRGSADTNARYAWNDAAVDLRAGAEEGFIHNGAAIVARSWSCSPNFSAGTNNVNCRNAKSFISGQMGYKPMEAEYDEIWSRGRGSRVPFIEWNEADARGDAVDVSVFPGLPHRERRNEQPGFITEQGRLWILGSASTNFKMIADEDLAIEYYYSVRGESGARTAARRGDQGVMTYVPKEQLKPVWIGNQSRRNPALTHLEFLEFRANEVAKKNDPWLHRPFKNIDLASDESEWNFGGKDYVVDYSAKNGGNEQFRRMIRQAQAEYPGWYTGGSGRVIIKTRNTYLQRRGSYGDGLNWPVVNYGLISPFRGDPSVPNALPVDFGAPVVINRWYDMLEENPGFSGA